MDNNVSRVMGIIWIGTSIVWGILSIVCVFFVSNWLEVTQVRLSKDIGAVVGSLDSVRILITDTTDVISATHNSLTTVQIAVHDASNSFNDLRPLLSKTTKVVTIDIPDTLDDVERSMPSLIEAASSIDDTLNWLSNFKFTIPNPFGTDWSYDLGINYQPEVPLDQALEEISDQLVDTPDDLRSLEENLSKTDTNLVLMSDDFANLADDIEVANQQLIEVVPKIEILSENMDEIIFSLQEFQSGIPAAFGFVRNLLVGLSLLIMITQIPSLYLGYLLAGGKFASDRFGNEDDMLEK